MSLIINGEEVEDEVIDGEFQQIKSHYEQLLQVACCERDPEFLGYAKDNVIARVLLSQEAASRIDEPDDEEVEKAKELLFEEHGGEDKFYLNMGLPFRDEDMVRENVRQSLRVENLLTEISAPLPEPSDDELETFYQEHIDHFLTPEEVQASHITKNLGQASNREEVYTHLRKVRKQLLDGADFASLAKEENDNPDQDIDLGFFKRGEFMEEFETIAFSMDEGEISPVFGTHLGLHLCTVTGRKPPEPKPLDEVKDAVLDLLHSQHREEKISAFVEELKTKATIEDTDPEDE